MILFLLLTAYPDDNGGSQITEFAAQIIQPDNTTRDVYKGRDLDCIVAGLSPGRPYLFQVRAFNRAGVSILWQVCLLFNVTIQCVGLVNVQKILKMEDINCDRLSLHPFIFFSILQNFFLLGEVEKPGLIIQRKWEII